MGFEDDGDFRSEVSEWIDRHESRDIADNTPAWLRGYEPFESQGRFHSIDKRFKGFSGPVGSGKSAALCREALRLAYLNPGRLGLVGAPTYPMLRDVTRLAFLQQLEENGIRFTFRKAENALYLDEVGSQVVFRSLDQPLRLIGTNLAWFAVDELTYTKEDAWRRLEARLRDPKAKQLCGFAVWTPKGFDWVYNRFLGEKKIDGYELVRAKPGENRVVLEKTPDYYERLKHSYDERFYAQEVLGEYLSVFAGRTYFAFDSINNVKAFPFDPNKPLCWSLDFNVNPMCSVLAQIVDGRVRVLGEMILPNSNTFEACEEFLSRSTRFWEAAQPTGWAAGTRPLSVVLYGDASGEQRNSAADRTDWRIIREFLKRHSDRFTFTSRVSTSNPAVKARINAVNALLRNHAGERRLMVAPTCTELKADFEQVAWRSDPNGNSLSVLDKSDPARTHVSDALGYLVEKEFGLKTVGGPRKTLIGV